MLLVFFTIFSYLFIDYRLIFLKFLYSGILYTKKIEVSLLYLFFIISFFCFYAYFLSLLKKKGEGGKLSAIVVFTVFILLFAYPSILSYDIYNYIATSKVTFLHRENPYIVMPIEFFSDPLLLFTRASNKIALYGPFWILLTGLPIFFGLGNFLMTVFSFKLLVATFYVLSIILVWKISKNIFSVAFFALNPLVVIESLVSGHNDIVMMFLALFSFYLLIKNKVFFAFSIFILSILIKYATFFLLPVFLFALFKTLKNEKIDWQKIFLYSYFSMFIIFLLSPLREELYPWYAIWFIPFVSLLKNHNFLKVFSVILSFGLLLLHIPYMLLGTYSAPVTLIKIIINILSFTIAIGLGILYSRSQRLYFWKK